MVLQRNGKWFNTARATKKDSSLGLNQNNVASQICHLCLVLLSAHFVGRSRVSEPCHGALYALRGVFGKIPQIVIRWWLYWSVRTIFNFNAGITSCVCISDDCLWTVYLVISSHLNVVTKLCDNIGLHKSSKNTLENLKSTVLL
jgi:hypothetical protein